MKKTFKRTSAFVCAMAVMAAPMTFSSFVANAEGETVTSDYTITIPATLAVANSGWNALEGGISAKGTLESGKKLVVTPTSENGWKLVSGENNVGYNLATTGDNTSVYSAAAEAPTWEFTELTADGTSQTAGIIVENYDSKPAGDYSDTVTFTASVENAVTTRIVTFNTATDGTSINKGGVTCSDSFDSLNNLFGYGSGFSVSSGQFTKIEVTATDSSMVGMDQWTMNTIEGWSTTPGTATWTGKSSTVPLGAIWGNKEPVKIVFTIEE